MTILIVHIQIKSDRVEDFRAATIENAQSSSQEPGVVRFDFVQHNDDPTRFVLYEVYRDQAASVAHKETAHYNTWAAKVAEMFAEPRTRAFYTNVFPEDQAW